MNDTQSVAAALRRIDEYSRSSFDSHPLLAEVGPPHFAYLKGLRARVAPPLTPAQLEDPEQLLNELAARLNDTATVPRFQAEADERCRVGYAKILPVARLLAAPPTPLPEPAEPGTDREPVAPPLAVRLDGPSLFLTQRLGGVLTNATVVVKLSTLTGRTRELYYFLPGWDADAETKLRLPAAWAGAAPVQAELEILSDTRSTPASAVDLPENRERAVTLAFQEIAAARTPVEAAAMLGELTKNAPDTPETRSAVAALGHRVRDAAVAQGSAVRREIAAQKSRNASLRTALKNRRLSDLQRASAQAQLTSGEARRTELEAYAAALRGVK